ncbi:MAG: DUF4878 domain-containing protein [Firmicutes bacterium]|nr:DUF4878 domain-containing protein [Bacillota bacterium]
MKVRKNLLFLVAVSLVACMILGGCGGVQSSPAKVVEAYFEAFQQKDMKTAFGYTLNDEINEEDLSSMEEVLKDFEIKSYKVEKVEKLNKTQAVVSVEVTTVFMGDENRSVSEIDVIKKDGKWYIDDGEDNSDWDEDRSPPEGPRGDMDDHGQHGDAESHDDAISGDTDDDQDDEGDGR